MLDHHDNLSTPSVSQAKALQLADDADSKWLLRFSYPLIYIFNWCLVRLLFRLTVRGRKYLPTEGPFLLTPNHASPLDPPVIAAAMPLTLLQNTFWAGKKSTVSRNWARRVLSRLTRVIPVAEDKSSVFVGTALLDEGRGLVWFPEGRRSLDGRLDRFKPGIALMLDHCDVPVVPVLIEGAHDAFSGRGSRLRLGKRISVSFGPPVTRDQLGRRGEASQAVEETLQYLRRCIQRLSVFSDAGDDDW